MIDLVALGESLIDCTPFGQTDQGTPLFSCNPGGAPSNVLAMFAKLGGTTAFIGKVGKDAFGLLLKKTMADAGIDTSALLMSEDHPTTLSFVQLGEKGERTFSFYRYKTADVMLAPEEIDKTLLQNCLVFHFGSVSMTEEPARSATLAAAQIAKAAGALISYDPNYRPLLWKEKAESVEQMLRGVSYADLVKVSEEEMFLLTGTSDPTEGAKALRRMGPCVAVVTMGAAGSFVSAPGGNISEPGFLMQTVDTTGAGDAFWGALLYCLRGKKRTEICTMNSREWGEILRFANAAGGLTTEKKGAIPAMPDKTAIVKQLNKAMG
ncbi:MAG: PfkB domain-containing protein [Clostridium sp.]|jgi:fructokinase